MKHILPLFSIALLLVLLAAAIAYAGGHLTEAANKQVMLVASIAWFVTAPIWMKSSAP